jgi:predicted RNase H-like HicB family nuclease
MGATCYTVILVPGEERWISVSVPSMPGCVSQGRSRDEALANARDAMGGWIKAEAEHGRGPLDETPAVVAAGVSEALEIIEEMRQAGEGSPDYGYGLELVSVAPEPLAAD